VGCGLSYHQQKGNALIFPPGATARTDAAAVSETVYDAVIVGGGIAGAIIANQLSRAGQRVLILEAGRAEDLTLAGYEEYLTEFYAAVVKDNQSPYPVNPNVPMPRPSGLHKITPGHPDTSGYLVQNGPYTSDTTYTRVIGGTTMHWEAKVLRMLPEDFQMLSQYGQGRDWPLGYDELEPYYRDAEREMGVSGDVEDQAYLGISYPPGYVFPMRGLPLSYLDKMVAKGVDGTEVDRFGEQFTLRVRAFPQARNGIPNPEYDGGRGYQPVGAVSTSQVEEGGRCQGNNNCVPICPVQAKYNAGKTLAKALDNGVEILAQAVAYKVHTDPVNGRVTHIEFRRYHDQNSAEYVTGTARGRIFVLCANAIENARLMLASGLPSSSGLMGRCLMDHAYLLSWGLLPEIAGTGRGTNSTGGIVDLRGGGVFRSKHAAFAIDIHNDGWGWATGSPFSDLLHIVDDENKFGPELRRAIVDQVSRQLLFAFMLDVPPSPSNRVAVDPAYRDRLGNMRPVISYDIPEYTMRGAAYARQLARRLFQRLGAEDCTEYDPDDYGTVSYEGRGYPIRGGNHLAGTHLMGSSPAHSVIDSSLRSWDHQNLYLAGGGSMPTIGTANVTLTLAALCLKSAGHMIEQLQSEQAPVVLSS
jgi:choline dehydrogenase-like flavoprotein